MRKAYCSSSAYTGRERTGSLSVLFLEPLAFWEITSVKCHLRDQAVDWCHFFPGPFPKHTNAKVSKSLCRWSLGSHSTGNAHVWASSCWNLWEEENEGTEHQVDSCLGRSGDKKTIPILFHDSLPSSEYNASLYDGRSPRYSLPIPRSATNNYNFSSSLSERKRRVSSATLKLSPQRAYDILGWKQLVNICLKEALNPST